MMPKQQSVQDVQPTLSDRLLFAKHPFAPLDGQVPRKLKERISTAHRTSRVFVFDRAASYRVGEIAAVQPELIADLQEFARNPYPNTFIQIDAQALMDAFKDRGLPTSALQGVAKDDMDFCSPTRPFILLAAQVTKLDGRR
jgi:hypothetical protein